MVLGIISWQGHLLFVSTRREKMSPTLTVPSDSQCSAGLFSCGSNEAGWGGKSGLLCGLRLSLTLPFWLPVSVTAPSDCLALGQRGREHGGRGMESHISGLSASFAITYQQQVEKKKTTTNKPILQIDLGLYEFMAQVHTALWRKKMTPA